MSHRTPLVALVLVAAISSSVLAQPTPTFSINNVNQAEGNAGTTPFTFTVTLSSPSSVETRVRYATSASTATVSSSSSSVAINLTVPGTGSGAVTGAKASLYPAQINLAGLPTVAGMMVRLLGVSHTFPSDMDILLVGPGGQTVLLMSDVGAGNDAIGANLEFRDGAPPIPSTITSGTYQPTNIGTGDLFPAPAPAGPYGSSLSVFNGTNPNGTWSLYVVDDLGADVGSITGWTLLFENSSGDYATAMGELVFAPAVTSQTAAVTVFGNTTVEAHEGFIVTLTNPVNAGLGSHQAVGLIINDDGGGPTPVAQSDTFVTAQNTTLSVAAPGVLGNDTSGTGGGPLSAIFVSGPAHGQAFLQSNGSFVYIPTAGYTGPDSFSYRALNQFAQSTVAGVAIQVRPLPVAAPDAYVTAAGRPLAVAAPGVLANDASNGGGALSAVLVAGVSTGSLNLNSDGSFTYIPAPGVQGLIGFTYRPVTLFGAGSQVPVTINIGPPPEAADDAFTVAFNSPLGVAAPGVLINDISNGGGPLTAVLVTSASHGSLSLAGDGGFTYTPNAGFVGSDAFTYRAQAFASSDVALVRLTVEEPTTLQPPTDLYVSAMSGNTVTFRFTPPALGPDATGFVLEGGLTPGQVLASIPTGSDAPIYSISAPTGSFYVRMHATNGSQKSGASNEIQIHVNVPVPPSAPDRLLGVVEDNTLALGWRNTFGGGGASSLLLDVSGAFVGTIPLGASESFSVGGVPAGTYTFSLRSANGGGVSAPGSPITVTVPGSCTGVPDPPSNFLLYRLGNTGYAVWEPPENGTAVTGYVLNVTGSFVGSFSTTTRSVSGAVGPGSYTVSVVAINACGSSPATPPQTIVVP